MSATTITVDRKTLERFMFEVDALASVEILRTGNHIETPLVEHIYRLLEDFENAVGMKISDERDDAAVVRGRELYLKWHIEAVAS